MTSEELREAIAEYFANQNYTTLQKSRGLIGEKLYYSHADNLMALLSCECYLKAERELPGNPYHLLAEGHYDGWIQGRHDLLSAGWRPVEEIKL